MTTRPATRMLTTARPDAGATTPDGTVTTLPGAAEAIAAARSYAASIADGAIGRDRSGAVPAAELAAFDAATLDEVTRDPRGPAEAARGSVAVAQAKAFASEVAVEVASDLFALSGASAADERYDLSRHWRNARTHASHDPVDWKYHHIGNYLLNDVLPPSHGQL
jgi:alkylation response protein AidB-like acyl-CoA dehydrogenase